MSLTIEEIKALPSALKMAGYLRLHAEASWVACQIRNSHPNDVNDEAWTKEQTEQYDKVCSESDPWYYSLNDYERMLLEPTIEFLGSLGRNEVPSLEIPSAH